jgi:hypothetical protein
MRNVLAGSIACIVAVACSNSFNGSSVDLTGDYTVALTDGANDCMFPNWTQGSSTQGIALDVQQEGSSVTGTVNGVAAVVLDALLGTHQFQGTVDGSSFTMTAIGSNAAKDQGCSYTVKATVTGTLDGDAIQGSITYTETTNGSSDCGYHATCSSVESYAGVRAPDAGAIPDAGGGG